MKTLILSLLATGGFLSLSACSTDDDEPAVRSTTTTTEESTVRHPVGATTETQTIRTY